MTTLTEADAESAALEWLAALVRAAAVERWLRDALLPRPVSGEVMVGI